MNAADIIATLGPHLPGVVLEPIETADSAQTPTILAPLEHLIATCRALQQTAGLEFIAFSDVTAVDFFPHREARFEVVYHFVSPHRRARVRLKVRAAADQPVPSISGL